MQSYQGFEQGPIRPPSEASSLLLRVTRNCPWNRCTFCSIYKKQKFSLRPVADVIADIDSIHRFTTQLQGDSNSRVEPGDNLSPQEWAAFGAARNWLAEGMQSIFLQDADSLVIRPENLIAILRHIKLRFPQVERITSYARSESVARISDVQMAEIAASGLNRIHIGMETASDTILQMIRKGASKEIHIAAGLKAKAAGIELSEYVLTGIGGREFSRDHAIETADALNQINPDFIRFRTLHLMDSVNLFAESDVTAINGLRMLIRRRRSCSCSNGLTASPAGSGVIIPITCSRRLTAPFQMPRRGCLRYFSVLSICRRTIGPSFRPVNARDILYR